MKGIIIYKGRYGATEQYAKWLGAELWLPVIFSDQISGKRLAENDFFVIGSSVYIGKLEIKKWLKNNEAFIKNKPIFFFQVAGTPAEEKETREAYNKNSIPASLFANSRFYYLHGKLVINKLSWKDKFMLKMGARLTKDPAIKKTMLTEYDDVKKVNIRELLFDLRSFISQEPLKAPKATYSRLQD
jgi:menaquinone-dependent protoporphyrinogen IX oxidase